MTVTGAKDDVGNYVLPTNAYRMRTYTCIDCENPVIVKKGELRKHHFAHKNMSSCTYFDHPNESQIHKHVKSQFAELLKSQTPINIGWGCDTCNAECYFSQEKSIIEYKPGDDIVLEYREKTGKWIADIAVINNGTLRYIFEIQNTHKTVTSRPEPWYEIHVDNFIYEHERINQEGGDIYNFSCQRTDIDRYCYGSFCWKHKWVKNIPCFKDITYLETNPCLLCGCKNYEPQTDGFTDAFTDEYMRVCITCLLKDTYEKKLFNIYGAVRPLFRLTKT
jgi:hypothetical protein